MNSVVGSLTTESKTRVKDRRRVSVSREKLLEGLSPDLQRNTADWSGPAKQENVWQIWKILLNEQEKIARAQLASVQVVIVRQSTLLVANSNSANPAIRISTYGPEGTNSYLIIIIIIISQQISNI